MNPKRSQTTWTAWSGVASSWLAQTSKVRFIGSLLIQPLWQPDSSSIQAVIATKLLNLLPLAGQSWEKVRSKQQQENFMGKRFTELTDAEREVYKQYHTQQASALEHRQQEEQLALQQQGYDVAHQAAQLLKERFGATRVVLFGSMLDASKLHSRSDIDLAVWGLPETGTTYFQAVGLLQGLSRFSIDLVEAQYAPDYIQEAIAQGTEL